MQPRWRAMDVKRQLEEAGARGQLVRIHRSNIEQGWVDGFVGALGPEFFAMEILDTAVRPDGFNCLRYSDVTECEAPAPQADFLMRALAARQLGRSTPPAIDLTSLGALLRSAQAAFPLVTIHLDEEGICFVGKALDVDADKVTLLQITPAAVWDETPTEFDLTEITRVDFGSGYEEALLLVAGAPK